MALPHKLKNMNLFNDGNLYRGKAKSLTLPALGRKMEAYRGGGMNGPVKADLGMSDDGIQLEWKLGGLGSDRPQAVRYGECLRCCSALRRRF